MKIVYDGIWSGREVESLNGYIYNEVCQGRYYEGEIEALRGEVDKLQEIVTRLVEHVVSRSREPTRTLKVLLEEEGCNYTVMEDDNDCSID